MKKNRLFYLMAFVGVLSIIAISCEESETEVLAPKQADAVAGGTQKSTKGHRTVVTDYTFTGQEGGAIALDLASSWMKNYQTANPEQTEAHFFGREIIDQLLSQPGSVGIRMYYALDDEGERQLILVGVDEQGNNLLPKTSAALVAGDYIVADMSYPCPAYCPD